MKTLPLADCCAPLLEEPLGPEEARRLAGAFKALGDPTRLRLLSLIAAGPGGRRCACELVEPLGLAQPTVSHHLKVLTRAGLLSSEKRGSWIFYRVGHEGLAALRAALVDPARAA